VTGFLVLSRGTTTRRIPFWFRVTRPQLRLDRQMTLSRPGIHRGNTRGKPSRVSCYRYPADPSATGVPACLRGPEQVFRVRLRRPVANFGVVVLRGPVQARIVRGANENLLVGYPALPLNINSYRADDGSLTPAVGAMLPTPGVYSIVFDSTRRARRGPFAFRFWVGDTTPPRVRLRSVRGGIASFVLRDGGSGVDPASIHASVDGHTHAVSYRRGIARVSGLARGRHTVTLRAADYQETKNMEDIGPILPNTRSLKVTIAVR
jgi:hypothetical protein